MASPFVLFFETLKLCRRIVRYGLTAEFEHIPALKTPLNLLALYVRPIRALPNGKAERLALAAKETGFAYLYFLRYSAAYPETSGAESAVLYTKLPRFPAPMSKEAVARTVAADFPAVKKEFFANVTPQMMVSAADKEQFKRQSEVIRRIIKKSVKLAWARETLARFDAFCKHLSRADMRLIAANLEELRKAFAASDDVFVPEVDWMRTSKNILVCKPYEKSAFQPTATVKNSIARVVPEMILLHGFFSLPPETPLEMTFREKFILGGSYFSYRLKGKERLFLYGVLKGLAEKNFKTVADAVIKAGMTNGTVPVMTLAQTCKNLYRSGEGKLSVGERFTVAVEVLSRKGVVFSPALRGVFASVLLYESICEDRQLWETCSAAELLHEYYRAEAPETEQSEAEQTDTVQEMRERVLTVPPVAEGMQALNAAKRAPFVKDPKWIAENLKKAQED